MAWNGGPGNARDRARFAALTAEQQDHVSALAADKYDGTRTVARCWAEALDFAALEHQAERLSNALDALDALARDLGGAS